MTEHVTRVEYRVIRPDGNLIWQAIIPSPMDVGWSIPPSGYLYLDANGPEILPPWRIERREGDNTEWALVAEREWTT